MVNWSSTMRFVCCTINVLQSCDLWGKRQEALSNDEDAERRHQTTHLNYEEQLKDMALSKIERVGSNGRSLEEFPPMPMPQEFHQHLIGK